MRLIDADALISNLFDYAITHEDQKFCEKVEFAINNAPTIEPKRGRWIKDEFGSFCECCGSYAYRDNFGKPWESDYCPNCGARMEEQNNE